MTLETKNDEIINHNPNPAIKIIEDRVKDREKLQSNFDKREHAYCGLEIEIITLKSILKQIK